MTAPLGRSATTFRTYAANASDYFTRHRDRKWNRKILRRFADCLPGPGPILDLGCGPGFDGSELRNWDYHVVGLDRTREALHLAGQHNPGMYVCADMRALPLRGRFAGGWACASLLHLEPEEMSDVLQRLSCLLLPEGVLYLSVKEGDGAEWDFTYGRDHPRWFTFWSSDGLDTALLQAGFEIRERDASIGSKTTWLRRMAVLTRCSAESTARSQAARSDPRDA